MEDLRVRPTDKQMNGQADRPEGRIDRELDGWTDRQTIKTNGTM